MRLPGLLWLLCAAAAAGAGGTAAGEGGLGGVDPRRAWELLAGSPARPSGSRDRGRTGKGRDGMGAGAAAGPAGAQAPGPSPPVALRAGGRGAAPAPPGAAGAPERLLRELQLLLKGVVKERGKVHRKVVERREEEEESSEGNPRAGSHRRVAAAFQCRTRENISVAQRARQELRLYYTPERERTFQRGSGLNLTSGHYTAPVAGYYAFTATLHIVHTEQRRKGRPCGGNRLRVLICVQSRCQHNSNLETTLQLESGSDFFTIPVSGVLYLQAGQYASVFVDNAAGSPLTVQRGSGFSAILLGV
ncbi:erythroferrone [Colius striatus]|uniref:erythroferrone n=1 Tax=Colius striatus TaxID=57412 RepID=UPI002B1D550C|nr:erythroferrone [Colius striatus]